MGYPKYTFSAVVMDGITGQHNAKMRMEDGGRTTVRQHDKNAEEMNIDFGHYIIWVISMFVMFWGTITIGYIVHAICAGVMGTWYFGTSRKRTITDSVVRAFTTSLGSISYASFILAVIRTMEQMARDQESKSYQRGDTLGQLCACMLKFILAIVGDLVKYFNSLALVRVAVYGEKFCVAAKRTMNMVKYRGMEQLINDDLSSMPVWLGCQIIFFIAVGCLFSTVKWITPGLVIVTMDEKNSSIAMWSFFFALCALFIPLSMLNVIPSFVQSLYVLWGDDPKAFDEVHPQESAKLKKAALECAGYTLFYDDHRIVGRC